LIPFEDERNISSKKKTEKWEFETKKIKKISDEIIKDLNERLIYGKNKWNLSNL